MGKKKANKNDDDDDLDAFLAAEAAKNSVELAKKEEEAPKAPVAPVPAPAATSDGEDDDAGGEQEGSSNAAKNKKKKKKKKAGGETEAKPSAHAKAILERQKAMQEEEERLRLIREEEERIEREEEEILRREEEEAKAKKEQRQKERLAKREADRKAGLLLSKKERAEQEKSDLYKQQMIEAGLVPAAGEENAKPKKPVYGKRKKTTKDSKDSKEQEAVPVSVTASQPADDQAELPADTSEADILDSWEEVAEEELIQALETMPTSLTGGEDSWEQLEIEDAEEERETSTAAEAAKAKGQEQEQVPVKGDLEHLSKKERSAKQKQKRNKEQADAKKAGSEDNLRSPICVIMGHVDTGKTKILDKMRRTNVQEGEAGGITQQIGATFFPVTDVKRMAGELMDNWEKSFDFKLPGLLVIDTPGHESFNNLRSRGSSLCDIAILVIDIMHGLEPQTIESLNLLRMRKTPFVVALNKVDRLYDWESEPWSPWRKSLARQPKSTQDEFESRLDAAKLMLAEQGLNSEVYYKNWKSLGSVVSIVPTSAMTGEGLPDLLMLIMQLTQLRMAERLMYVSSLQATILEVKVIEGLGTTIDVILVNGVLYEGDTIVLCGLNGPIVSNIRALLTPKPMKEMRVKGEYVHHKKIVAAQGVKISGPDLDKVVAGSQFFVAKEGDDIEALQDEVMEDLQAALSRVDTAGRGVYVQASTLGSLEALLEFLRESKIPVSAINIGPVHKKDVVKASVMLQHCPEYAIILAFDVKVEKDARELADKSGVKIFTAEIIYHLFDQFTKWMTEIKAQRKANAKEAVFPCICSIVPNCVFNSGNPIIVGVHIDAGLLKVGTPLCIPAKRLDDKHMVIGRVASIEHDKKPIEVGKKGQEVAIKIEPVGQTRWIGRHFQETDAMYSLLSREAIDALKEHFRDELTKDEWKLVKKLKETLFIV